MVVCMAVSFCLFGGPCHGLGSAENPWEFFVWAVAASVNWLSSVRPLLLDSLVLPKDSLVQLRQFPSISLLPRSSPKRSPQVADLRGGLDFFSNFSSTYSFRTTALLCSASCDL